MNSRKHWIVPLHRERACAQPRRQRAAEPRDRRGEERNAHRTIEPS